MSSELADLAKFFLLIIGFLLALWFLFGPALVENFTPMEHRSPPYHR